MNNDRSASSFQEASSPGPSYCYPRHGTAEDYSNADALTDESILGQKRARRHLHHHAQSEEDCPTTATAATSHRRQLASENDELRRRVDELRKYARDLEERLEAAAARPESSSSPSMRGETEIRRSIGKRKRREACGRRPRDEDRAEGTDGDDDETDESECDEGDEDEGDSEAEEEDQRESLSLKLLEEMTPNPVGETEDNLAIDGRTDAYAAFVQKCNWLRAFKAKYGHCNVPSQKKDARDCGFYRLANFVMKVRQQYHVNARGEQRRGRAILLTPERIKTLEDIGISWETRMKPKPSFEDMYEKLKAFYDERGHCCVPAVPTDELDDPELAGWTREQSHFQRARKIPDESSCENEGQKTAWRRAKRYLTDERQELLEKFDCPWLHAGRTQFGKDSAAENSCKDKKEDEPDGEGRLEAPPRASESSDEEERDNGGEESNFEASYSNPETTPESSSKAKRSKDAPKVKNFSWYNWFYRFEELRRFKAQNGHLFVETRYVNTGLGGWVKDQRRIYNRIQNGKRTATLADEYQIKKLQDMGLVLDLQTLQKRDEKIGMERAKRERKTKFEESTARMARMKEAVDEAVKNVDIAKQKVKDAEAELRKAKKRALEAKKAVKAEAERMANDPIGKHAKIMSRGGTKRTGLARITVATNVTVVGEELTFYGIAWPDGEEESAVEGRYVKVLYTEAEVERALNGIEDVTRRPTEAEVEKVSDEVQMMITRAEAKRASIEAKGTSNSTKEKTCGIPR